MQRRSLDRQAHRLLVQGRVQEQPHKSAKGLCTSQARHARAPCCHTTPLPSSWQPASLHHMSQRAPSSSSSSSSAAAAVSCLRLRVQPNTAHHRLFPQAQPLPRSSRALLRCTFFFWQERGGAVYDSTKQRFLIVSFVSPLPHHTTTTRTTRTTTTTTTKNDSSCNKNKKQKQCNGGKEKGCNSGGGATKEKSCAHHSGATNKRSTPNTAPSTAPGATRTATLCPAGAAAASPRTATSSKDSTGN